MTAEDSDDNNSACMSCKGEYVAVLFAVLLSCNHTFCKAYLRECIAPESGHVSSMGNKCVIAGKHGEIPVISVNKHSESENNIKGTSAVVDPQAAEELPHMLARPACNKLPGMETESAHDMTTNNCLLENIVNRYESGSDSNLGSIPCQFCEEDPPRESSKACRECKYAYCNDCFKANHRTPKRGPNSNHEIISPQTLSREKLQVKCAVHREEALKIYCQECEAPICHLCSLVGLHKGHSVDDIKAVMGQEKRSVQRSLENLLERRSALQHVCHDLDRQTSDITKTSEDLVKEMKEQCAYVIQEIQKRQDIMLEHIAKAERDGCDQIEKEKLQAKALVDSSEGLAALTAEALKEQDPVSFIQASKVLQERLRGQSEDCSEACRSADVTFFRKILPSFKPDIQQLLSALKLYERPGSVENLQREGTIVRWDPPQNEAECRPLMYRICIHYTPNLATEPIDVPVTNTDKCELDLTCDEVCCHSEIPGPVKLTISAYFKAQRKNNPTEVFRSENRYLEILISDIRNGSGCSSSLPVSCVGASTAVVSSLPAPPPYGGPPPYQESSASYPSGLPAAAVAQQLGTHQYYANDRNPWAGRPLHMLPPPPSYSQGAPPVGTPPGGMTHTNLKRHQMKISPNTHKH